MKKFWRQIRTSNNITFQTTILLGSHDNHVSKEYCFHFTN